MFENTDGWWDKYIKNIGPVMYLTANNRPHWQCTICKNPYRSYNIGDVRQHVYKEHKHLHTKMGIE